MLSLKPQSWGCNKPIICWTWIIRRFVLIGYWLRLTNTDVEISCHLHKLHKVIVSNMIYLFCACDWMKWNVAFWLVNFFFSLIQLWCRDDTQCTTSHASSPDVQTLWYLKRSDFVISFCYSVTHANGRPFNIYSYKFRACCQFHT